MSQLIPDDHMSLRPIQHYEIADALLARAEGMNNDTLPIARAIVARAQVHALLASCSVGGGDVRQPVYAEDDPLGFAPLETRTPTGDRL